MMRADRSLIATAGAARSRGRFLRNYFDVSGLCDVRALRALYVLACAGKTARDSGQTLRETLRPSGTIGYACATKRLLLFLYWFDLRKLRSSATDFAILN